MNADAPARVLVLSPLHEVGGVEAILRDLCSGLPRLGFELTLGVPGGTAPEGFAAALLPLDGVTGSRPGRLRALDAALRRLDPDLVLVRYFDAYEAVARAKRDRGRPRLVSLVRVFDPAYLFDARLYRESIDLCVTSGELLRQLAVRWSGVPADRVESLPGGVRPALRPVEARRSRRPLRLGYVGRLEQDQKRVLDAAALLRELDGDATECHLDIVGTGPAEGALRSALAPWLASGRARMHGYLTTDRLYEEVYPSLDVFVHCAAAEGVTIAPREAMAHGVVPVVARFPGHACERQFVHEETALTFPVGDVPAAAACIRRLTSEPDLLPRLSAAASASQQGRYSAQGALDAWAAALRRCLELPPRRGPVPVLALPADGRLARLGVPTALAERLRRVFARRHVHASPWAAWPTRGTLATRDVESELAALADEIDEPFRARP